MADPSDPAALFHEMLGQWERLANSAGGDFMKTDQFAQTMHGATAATVQTQAMVKAAMDRALATANMPSRDEVADLSARLARVEASLERIEAAVTTLASGAAADPQRPRPARTRTPPPRR